MALSLPPDISIQSAREQLEAILASSVFANAERLRRFLRFVVQRALEGKGDEIKEYLIGVEVFDRSPTFDPRIDPVVRVEARRLRAKLSEYYTTLGQADTLLIEIPKGSYIPVLERRQIPRLVEPVPAAPSAWKWAVLVGAVLVIATIAAYWLISVRQRSSSPSSIAVLPFLNLGGTPEGEYFADGFVEELTTSLAQIEGLRVVARTSAFQFQGKSPDIRTAGRQLGVETVLEGSVWINANKVRITAQLIKTVDGFHLWSQTYEREQKDVFAIQDDVIGAIARALNVQFSKGGQLAGSRAPRDLEAYNLYLKGQFFRNRRTAPDVQRSIQYLEDAIQRDRTYSPAYAALADAYASVAYYETAPDPNAIAKAKAAAAEALKLDSTLAEAHAVLAWISFFYDWNWQESDQEFRRALELNPNSARVHDLYSQNLMSEGRFEEAIVESKKALVLDPLNAKVSTTLSVIYFCAHRYDEAIRQARQALEIDPHFFLAHTLLGDSLQEKRMFLEAEAELQTSVKEYRFDTDTTAHLAVVQTMMGNKEAVPKLIDALEHPSDPKSKAYYQLAYLYSARGDKTRAFDALEKAYEQRTSDMPFLNVDPIFDGLHQDPRFHTLQKKMGWAKPLGNTNVTSVPRQNSIRRDLT